LKVLYIIGNGRSGSTLIDAIVGNHDDIFSTGELKKLWRQYEFQYCSCGEERQNCPFWKSVRQDWKKMMKLDQFEKKLIPLTNHYEKFIRWPLLLKEQKKFSNNFKNYVNYNLAIFETVKRNSGKSIVIDSSKVPERAFALSLIPGIELYFIHLIRDGRGVIWSRKKRIDSKAHPYATSNTSLSTTLKWIKSNLVSEYVLQRTKAPSIRIKYEDFVNNPFASLSVIGEMMNLDMSKIADKIKENRIAIPNHMIGGNRVRFEKTIKLKNDNKWINKLSFMDKIVFALFAWPLAKKYKYKVI